MPLTILSDSDVRHLLLQLTKQDILDLQQSLADALHYYSTATEEDTSNGCSSSYQPLRTSLKRGDGQTTLLMPASSNDGMGVKIVTIAAPDDKTSKSRPSEDTASAASSLSSLSVSQQSSKSSIPQQSLASAQSTTPKGSLTLFDKSGAPRAFLNAEEITAFRTALASTMLFKKRQNVHDVVVFGAGKQAYWHIRLALLLRGPDIHHLNIINRDFDRVHHLLSTLYEPHEEPQTWSPDYVPKYRNIDVDTDNELARPKIQILTPNHGEYARLLKSTIRASSVIFFTTPSTSPLFPAEFLTNAEGRKKGRYLAAIGSYKPNMIEIHPDILRQNVAPEHGHRHFHKHAAQSGAVVVDSVEACLKEAGEVIQAKLGPNEVVEIGELLMLKRDAERRRLECAARRSEEGLDEGGVELGECEKIKKKRRGSGKGDGEGEDKAHKSLMEWLQRGNVIYKSVGLGLMDVVVGMDLVRLADERGIGTKIENF
ncbi:NAD(P)-binding protein [Ophiobolus disseminans]|uniref:NAD(P)-binding protein n=1 Tax=Ophiobolus disseminans TaxID=1469910 RepID=A0A6A7ABH7_9PLEO|nr:NAD(P)-binding protein [Ophiobolus disseminans]